VNPAALSVTPRSHVPRAFEARPARRGSRPHAADGLKARNGSDEALDTDAIAFDGGDRPGGPLRPRFNLRSLTRRHLMLAAGGLVAAWIALVIAGAVGDSSAVNQRAAALRQENAALQARLEMTRREVELVQSEPYVDLEARAFGMGRGNERAFSLQPGAPPPQRLRLLGEDPDGAIASSPVDDWLDLLFGA
jgi:cell division protein FtsB